MRFTQNEGLTLFKTLHINFTVYLFLYFKTNVCLSAVFTSSGLLRKNRERPSRFHLPCEALHFHAQARIFLEMKVFEVCLGYLDVEMLLGFIRADY